MREGANRSHASLPSENARPHPPFGHLLPEGEGQKRPAMPALSSSCEPTISRRAYRGDPHTHPARSFPSGQHGPFPRCARPASSEKRRVGKDGVRKLCYGVEPVKIKNK